jgi:hypothetical protein
MYRRKKMMHAIRPIWFAAAAGWALGLYLLLVGTPNAKTPAFFEPSVTFWARSANAAEDEREATSRVEALAESQLAETLGSAHEVVREDGSRLVTPAYEVDGHVVRLADLERTTLVKREDIQEVFTSSGVHRLSKPTDVWVAEWKRDGLAVSGWTAPATLKILVIVEDGSWKLLSASLGVSDPNAEPAPADNRPREERCQPIDGFGSDAELCFRHPVE